MRQETIPDDFSARLRMRLSQWKKGFQIFAKSKLNLVGLILVLAYLILAIAAPLIAPPPAGTTSVYSIPKTFSLSPLPPSSTHLFGTTGPQYYSDIFYGVVWGSRLSQFIAFSVMLISLGIGIPIGAAAGYFGGKVDEILMRFTDVFFAIPGLILALVMILVLGRGVSTIILAIGLVNWPGYARLIRGEFLRVKNEPFVEAAHAIGVSDFRIIFKHILPNAFYPVIVVASLSVGYIVLLTSALGFLGVGLVPGTAEWGVLISLSRNWLLAGAWWTMVFPGMAIFIFVLGWTLLGDGLRDTLDPKARRLI